MGDVVAPEDYGVAEHPGIVALRSYWRRIGDGSLPGRSDLDPADIPRILGNVMLIDVERAPIRFRMRLCGTTVDRVFGQDFTGYYLDDLTAEYFERDVLLDYAGVVTTQRPHFLQRTVAIGDGVWLAYQRLLLPLSDDGSDVDMLLGGVFGSIEKRMENASYSA
jgi:hypothetical protein